jgi:hypothetical protein
MVLVGTPISNAICKMILSLGLGDLVDREINVVVVATSGIEVLTTTWAATFALHILMNGQRCPAGATKYGSFAPFRLGPYLDRMIGERVMTILASIVDATALHLDRDDVSGSVIVLATGLPIKIDAMNFWKNRHHGGCRKRNLQPIVSNSS